MNHDWVLDFLGKYLPRANAFILLYVPQRYNATRAIMQS